MEQNVFVSVIKLWPAVGLNTFIFNDAFTHSLNKNMIATFPAFCDKNLIFIRSRPAIRPKITFWARIFFNSEN
jgi:hypothetical protein